MNLFHFFGGCAKCRESAAREKSLAERYCELRVALENNSPSAAVAELTATVSRLNREVSEIDCERTNLRAVLDAEQAKLADLRSRVADLYFAAYGIPGPPCESSSAESSA